MRILRTADWPAGADSSLAEYEAIYVANRNAVGGCGVTSLGPAVASCGRLGAADRGD